VACPCPPRRQGMKQRRARTIYERHGSTMGMGRAYCILRRNTTYMRVKSQCHSISSNSIVTLLSVGRASCLPQQDHDQWDLGQCVLHVHQVMEYRLFRVEGPKRKRDDAEDPATKKIEPCPAQQGHAHRPLLWQEPPSEKEQKRNQSRNAAFRTQHRKLRKISTIVDKQS